MNFRIIYDKGELGQEVFEGQSHKELWDWKVKNPPGPFVQRIWWDNNGFVSLQAGHLSTFDQAAYEKAVEDKRWTEEYYRRTGKQWTAEGEPKASTESGHNIKSEKFKLTEDECMELLDLKSGFSQTQLKEAWRETVKRYHPDKVAELASEFKVLAEKRTKQINHAHDLLRKKRKKGD